MPVTVPAHLNQRSESWIPALNSLVASRNPIDQSLPTALVNELIAGGSMNRLSRGHAAGARRTILKHGPALCRFTTIEAPLTEALADTERRLGMQLDAADTARAARWRVTSSVRASKVCGPVGRGFCAAAECRARCNRSLEQPVSYYDERHPDGTLKGIGDAGIEDRSGSV